MWCAKHERPTELYRKIGVRYDTRMALVINSPFMARESSVIEVRGFDCAEVQIINSISACVIRNHTSIRHQSFHKVVFICCIIIFHII